MKASRRNKEILVTSDAALTLIPLACQKGSAAKSITDALTTRLALMTGTLVAEVVAVVVEATVVVVVVCSTSIIVLVAVVILVVVVVGIVVRRERAQTRRTGSTRRLKENKQIQAG